MLLFLSFSSSFSLRYATMMRSGNANYWMISISLGIKPLAQVASSWFIVGWTSREVSIWNTVTTRDSDDCRSFCVGVGLSYNKWLILWPIFFFIQRERQRAPWIGKYSQICGLWSSVSHSGSIAWCSRCESGRWWHASTIRNHEIASLILARITGLFMHWIQREMSMSGVGNRVNWIVV